MSKQFPVCVMRCPYCSKEFSTKLERGAPPPHLTRSLIGCNRQIEPTIYRLLPIIQVGLYTVAEKGRIQRVQTANERVVRVFVRVVRAVVEAIALERGIQTSLTVLTHNVR